MLHTSYYIYVWSKNTENSEIDDLRFKLDLISNCNAITAYDMEDAMDYVSTCVSEGHIVKIYDDDGILVRVIEK